LINEYVLRYVYYMISLTLVLVADGVVDKESRASRLIRLVVYASPLIAAPLIGVELNLINTLFIFLASLGSIMISLYSEGYLRILFGKISTLQAIVDVCLVFIIMFFTSQRLVEFIILWIIVELMGSLLVLLEKGMRNYSVVMKYLLVCVTAGDISLFTLLALVAGQIGFDKTLLLNLRELPNLGLKLDPVLTILVLIGFTTKLAQIPLHFWMIDTYVESPSPATAIFSGLMSKMAIYAILIIYSSLGVDKTTYMILLFIQGFMTTIYGFFMTSIHSDIKKIMSYSSMGYYGLITLLLSLLPYEESISLIIPYQEALFMKRALFISLFHGIVKIQVFLNIGSIELLTNTRDIYRLGYLAQIAGNIYNYSIITFLSLIGLPPTLGFIAKFATIFILLNALTINPLITISMIAVVVFSFIFSLIYSMKYLSIYTSSYKSRIIKPPIELTKTQSFSETLGGVALISLIPLYLIIGLHDYLDTIVAVIYIISLSALMLALVVWRNMRGREVKIWLGGVEY